MSDVAHRWFAKTVAVAVLAFLTIGADRCPPQRIAQALTENYRHLIEDDLGFAVYIQPGTFPPGTTFAADIPGLGASPPARVWRCHNRCKLVMLDLSPWAHFSHTVVLATFDTVTGRLDADPAEWWPFDLATGQRFFHTEATRRGAVRLCSQDDCAAMFPLPRPHFVMASAQIHQPLFAAPPPGKPASKVWAVVVNGYGDSQDTFDNDSDGMYRVLQALGVPDWRICYLSDIEPPAGAPKWIDAEARPSTVRSTFGYLTALLDGDSATDQSQAGKTLCGKIPLNKTTDCDELLFFISTHGFPGTLSCNHDKLHGGGIDDDELARLINNIKCKHKTVIIEACKSGSFLTALQDTDRSIFVSADATTDSYKDRDPYCEPGDATCVFTNPQEHDPNPGDAGSEVMWGFLEAFGTSGADLEDSGGIKDGRISFTEAVDYAIDNNASPASPKSYSGGATPWFPFHGDFNPAPTTLSISDGPFTSGATETEAGPQIASVERCQFNSFTLKIKNTGTMHLAAGTLRMYSSGPLDSPPKPSDHGLTVIVPGLAPSTEAAYHLSWFADGELNDGDDLSFVFSLDAPQSPGATHPQQLVTLPVVVKAPSSGLIPCGCRTCCG